MRIRTKLVVALVVPLVALLVLSWVAVTASNDSADEAAERAQLTEAQVALGTASIGPAGVITAIQSERNIATATVSGFADILGEDQTMEGAREATDAALDDFRSVIAGSDVGVQEAYREALQTLDAITQIRADSDAIIAEREATGRTAFEPESAAENAEVFDAYTGILLGVFDINTAVVVSLDDEELRGGAHFVNELGRANELQARLMRYVGLALTSASQRLVDDPDALIEASRAEGQIRAIQQELETSGPARYRELAATTFADDRLAHSVDVVRRAMAGEVVEVTDLTSNEAIAWSDVYDDHRNTASAELALHAQALIEEAQAEHSDARDQARLVTIGTILVILAAVGIALVAARSVARPLRRLVDDAETMASKSLPQAVQTILDAPLGDDVTMPELAQVSAEGGAEIGELASALNTVQDSAAELAIEQAILRRNISDSFVNLGRRNQNLLSRQLDSITEMERDETDPDELEKLFALDHLATRMRRNAESLLLLAGLEPHRQWSAPVALIDVIRGALGEVEDYARVEIGRFDEATVNGTVAADITHLVAELLENALNFSPPGRNVVIAGARRDNGYMLAIVDNGIGMDPEAMAQANVRLAGGESFTVAPSRYLGHYVVGIQAARLKTPVSLQDTPVGGVTALIDISALLVDEDAPVPTGAEPALDEPAEGSDTGITLDLSGVEAATPDTAPVNPVAAGPTIPFEEASSYTGAAPEPIPAVESVPAPIVEPEPAPPAAAPQPEPVAASERPEPGAYAPAPGQEPAGGRATDHNGVAGRPVTEPVARTASGYKKRVRGSHAPRTDVISARGDKTAASAVEAEPTSTADQMRSMLSGLQAGAQRAEAEVAEQDENREDRR